MMSLGLVETMSTEGEYDARIVADPDEAEAWSAKAKLRLSQGDHQAGVEFAIAATSRAGAVPEAGRLLVEAAARAGDAHLLGLAAKRHLQLFPDERGTTVFKRRVPPRLLVPTPQDAEELDAFNQVLATIRDRRPRRYGQLLQCLLALRPRSILEIGVFDGRNAADMIRAGGRTPARTGALRYVGFDLFEEMTPEVHEKEFSKYPLSRAEIGGALSAFNQNHLLIQGYTQDTLKAFRQSPDAGPIDFVFIDGGHSEETIQSDWDNVAPLMSEKTVVIFDDCYLNKVKELDGLGCNSLVERLARDPRYVVEMLPVRDSFDKDFGVLTVALVKVRLRPRGGALRRLLRINPWRRPATGRS
ncbi:putative O-methyltransferase YrrM [Nitrospirillum amazonense]|uniref:Putative O-methyltransferase YrrM n=2 Tax=Nitrospirillum amazonense TaxID=28077 RepID=A0A560FSL4_9PROT|nr:putative O-methyltransferase YrrM [Nitrospirillum amazonense]